MRAHKRSLLLALLLCLIGVITMAGIYRREKNDDSAGTDLAEFSDENAADADASAENAVTSESGNDSVIAAGFSEKPSDDAVISTESFDEGNDAEADAPADEDPSAETAAEDASASYDDTDAADWQMEETLSGTVASDLNFQSDSVLTWPVQGELLMEFSMEQPVYFATLAQYKLCPGILVQAEEGSIVYAGADACVTAVGESEELGQTVTLDLGNGYTALYGQLKAVNVSEGDMLSAGAALGLVAAPTKYYCVEGDHVYLQLEKDGTPIDPLDYLD